MSTSGSATSAPTSVLTAQTSQQEYAFAQVDVFAEHPLEGNALAVFTDARGLSSAEMQAIARETNLSETTFILPRAAEVERERGVQVRIFTTREELEFAGHPTLGTASWLHLNHPLLRGAREITLELRIGPIKVNFTEQQQEPGVFATMRQNDPNFGEMHSPRAVADALGLALDDLDLTLPIQTVSTGVAFCIVPLRSLEVAARLAIPQAESQAYLAQSDAKFFYCMTRAATDRARTGTRACSSTTEKIPPRVQPPAAPSPIWFAMGSLPAARRSSSNRASRCCVPAASPFRLRSAGDRVTDVRVGGRTIPIASGRVFLPRCT